MLPLAPPFAIEQQHAVGIELIERLRIKLQRTKVIDDAGITIGVKSRLLDDPLVKGLKIDVDTRDGVVFLTGSVGSDAEREKAIQIAKDAKGVRDVKANLTISKG